MRRYWLALALAVVGACTQAPASLPAPIAAATSPAVVAPTESVRAQVVPSHDLSVDERRGGHTLARHVGRSDEQLRERLRREPGISSASTYTDRPTAERVVGASFQESADVVDRWTLRIGRRPNLVLDRDEPSAIGRSLRRGQRVASDCAHAVVVLRWDEAVRQSYVLTSYPECRR